MRWLYTLAALVLAAALAGCSGGRTPGLAGTRWVLTEIEQGGASRQALAGTEVTLAFTADQASGSSGCNSYGGGYAARGATIKLSQLASTMMACVDAGVMDQEAAYLAALGAANAFPARRRLAHALRPGITLRFRPA